MPLSPDRLRELFPFHDRELRRRPESARSYRALRQALDESGFDATVQERCRPWRASKRGRPPLPAGWLYRIAFAAYLEGVQGDRAAAELCESNPAIREFVGVPPTNKPPHHSSIGVFRKAIPEQVHTDNFALLWKQVLRL